jgi:hypothetical protein
LPFVNPNSLANLRQLEANLGLEVWGESTLWAEAGLDRGDIVLEFDYTIAAMADRLFNAQEDYGVWFQNWTYAQFIDFHSSSNVFLSTLPSFSSSYWTDRYNYTKFVRWFVGAPQVYSAGRFRVDTAIQAAETACGATFDFRAPMAIGGLEGWTPIERYVDYFTEHYITPVCPPAALYPPYLV